MKKVMIIVGLFFAVQGIAQVNLVPNPSFEVYVTCPNGADQLDRATPWFRPTQGTPDYFNVCFDTSGWGPAFGLYTPNNIVGYQVPKSGVAYSGFLATYPVGSSNTPYREYLEVRLASPMVASQKYFITMWVSLSDSSNYATDDIGVCFSNDSILNDTTYILYSIPQFENSSSNTVIDKLNWTLISGEYVAFGGEEFIAIGNFKNDLLSDTVFVSGGGNINNSDYTGGYYYVDDVCISTDSLLCANGNGIGGHPYYNIEIYPNPVQGILTVELYNEDGNINIYNVLGEVVYRSDKLTSGVNEIDLSKLSNGTYFLHLTTETDFIKQQFVLIH